MPVDPNAKVLPPDAPTSVDFTKQGRADLSKDVRNMLESDISDEDEVLQGIPQIRTKSLQRSNVAVNQTAQVAQSQPTQGDAYTKYRANLSDEYKAIFDFYIGAEPKFPTGFTAIDAMNLKLTIGDFYHISLSKPYIYKPLTAQEHKRISDIKGITQAAYINHVVSTCVIAPQISLMNVDVVGFAGTKQTLYEQILAYSDYATNETFSTKL